MSRHNDLGKEGEQKALVFLTEKGYRILATNWRSGRAEIDIIAQEQQIIVFVEVKTRSNYAFGFPEASVNSAKQKLMAKAAGAYLHSMHAENEIRFDILALHCAQEGQWSITHFEDAFFPNPADEIDDYD